MLSVPKTKRSKSSRLVTAALSIARLITGRSAPTTSLTGSRRVCDRQRLDRFSPLIMAHVALLSHRLLRLHADGFDDVGPFIKLRVQELCELLRRASNGLRVFPYPELIAELRIGQRRCKRLLKLDDYLPRCFRRCDNGVPRRAAESGDP